MNPKIVTPLLWMLASCGFSDVIVTNDIYLDSPMWDTSPIPSSDGLYVSLTHTGGLALVQTNGSFTEVDLGIGQVSGLSISPNEHTLLAFVTITTCPDDPDAVYLSECIEEEKETSTELLTIEAGEIAATTSIDEPFNVVKWSESGDQAIAYLDLNRGGVSDSGVMSLTTILVLDLENNTATPVSVGFEASNILFHPDSNKAVVLSQSEVAVVDLTTTPPSTAVTYPLTLDPDDVVEPVGVALTPDGNNALISVQGDDVLYQLNLVDPYINMVTLSGAPSAMAVDSNIDRSLFVYTGSSVVDLMDHTYFDVKSYNIDEPMDEIHLSSTFALLSSTRGYKDVYRLVFDSKGDDVTTEVIEYRLQQHSSQIHVTPTEDFAVALTEYNYATNYYGMEVLDLRGDSNDSYPYALESRGMDLAFSEVDGETSLLLLQEDIDYVYKLNLSSNDAEEFDLEASPENIGVLPDGTFYVTHTIPTGLISFINPTTGEITTACGFGVLGLTSPTELSTEGAEQ